MTDDLGLVPTRRLFEGALDVVFELSPGDRALVEPGTSVVVGAPIAELLRDPRMEDHAIAGDPLPAPGDRWRAGEVDDDDDGPAIGSGSAHRSDAGEVLFPWKGRWRVTTGDIVDVLEAPIAGIVRDVRPGTSITIRAAGHGLRGIAALGGSSRGRLRLAPPSDGGLRPAGLDVGMAGSILVVDGRIDAETLTRARAMGVRGIVVAGIASKERRDFLASEARQRAALHRLPSFAVLLMEGAARRPMAGALRTALAALAGREVAIVADPPALLYEATDADVPRPDPEAVRIRAGALTGQEGRWVGSAGRRRLAGLVETETGRVALPDGTVVAVPLGDLERFV